jgi:hypothetical protein
MSWYIEWQTKNKQEEAKHQAASSIAAAKAVMLQADTQFDTANALLDSVLWATQLTPAVLNKNTLAQAAYDTFLALVVDAGGYVQNAAFFAQMSDDGPTQIAVSQVQAALTTLVEKSDALIEKLALAEAHKDVIVKPLISVVVKCKEYDSCSDNDPLQGVTVTVVNGNTVPPPGSDTDYDLFKEGTTDGSGTVTLFGRFGNSEISITADSTEKQETLNQTHSTGASTMTASFLFDE